MTEKDLLENVFYADFETTSEANLKTDGETRIYMWGIKSAYGEYYTGTSINSFYNQLRKIMKEHPRMYVFYHNLKFDFSFIEDYLLRNKVARYKQSNSKINFRTSWGKEYTTVRDDANNMYGATQFFGKGKGIIFRDSLKIFPTSLKVLGEQIGVKKLDEDFDYEKYIPKGYQPTDKEWEYLDHDIEILRQVMNKQIKTEGSIKMTRTGYAFSGLRKTYNAKNQPIDFNPKAHGLDKKETIFELHFPKTEPELYKEIKLAYSGGIVYVNETLRDRKLEKLLVYDVNSEYPGAMCKYHFPIHKEVKFDGVYSDVDDETKQKYPLYIQFFKAKFTLKKGGFPCISKKYGKQKNTVYSTDDLEPMKKLKPMCMTNVDLEHFLKNYDVHEIKYYGGYMWQSVFAPFKEFIDQQMVGKIGAEAAYDKLSRTMYKLNMNGCYGKFAQSPYRASKDTALNDKDLLSYSDSDEEPEAQFYFPMAIFVASYARDILLTGVYAAGVDRVVYIDTDSIHITGWEKPETLDIHPTEIGKWKLEGYATEGKYLRDKCYAEVMVKLDKQGEFVYENGVLQTELDIKAAGLTDKVKAKIKSIDDFMLGTYYDGMLNPTIVKGGIVLKAGGKYLSPLVVRRPNKAELERDRVYKEWKEEQDKIKKENAKKEPIH